MKKIIIIILLLFANLSSIDANEQIYAEHAKAAYVMEVSTNKVIFQKNDTKKLYPASMTKMMGLILIYEALNNHSITMEDEVICSAYAASMGGSQIFLEENERITVHDLLKSICIASANDAMVAMAEKISGSEDRFVSKMNEKAKLLKLKNTHFVNATGLHDEKHYSCAQDMAYIAQYLLEVGGKDLLEITSTYEDYIRQDKEEQFWLVNTNKLIRQFEGVDGLKTGYTSQAQSCITVTAQKDEIRFIVVVMGEPDSKTRNKEVIDLLNYSFSLFDKKCLFKNGQYIDSYKHEQVENPIKLYCEEEVVSIYPKGSDISITSSHIEWLNKKLPYKKGDRLAKLQIDLSNGEKQICYLITKKDITKMNFFDYFEKYFQYFF